MSMYIFPIKENAKSPALVRWGTQSSDDPGQIRTWMRRWPTANYGLDCGKSNIAVVDVDTKNGKVGQQTLDQLEAEYGKLPETRMSKTWSGGTHYLFRGSIPSTASKLGKDVDTRGRGGMVLLPGSKIDGYPYTWLNEKPFAPLPDWVANLAARAVESTVLGHHLKYNPDTFPKREGKVESLAEGLEREEMPPLDYGPLIGECAFFRDALKSGGKDYSQPMWNLTTLVATFLESGHAIAHRLGNQHADYDRDSTDALWNRKRRERKDRGLGWPSCSAIQAAGSTGCAACPHLSAGKSPLNFTGPRARSGGALEEAVARAPLITLLPRTFARDRECLLIKLLPIKEAKSARTENS